MAHHIEYRADDLGVLAQHQGLGHGQPRIEQGARDPVFAVDRMRRRKQDARWLAAQHQPAGRGFKEEGGVRLAALELVHLDVAGQAGNDAAEIARQTILIELAAGCHGDGRTDLRGGGVHAALRRSRYLSSSIRASWRS